MIEVAQTVTHNVIHPVIVCLNRLTCIYIACKAEEFHVSADELGKGIKQDPQVVLKNEMAVLLASRALKWPLFDFGSALVS